MAQVTVEGKVIRDAEAIVAVLKPHGVEYERWTTERVPTCAQERDVLEPAEKEQVLGALSSDIHRLIETKGYRTADIVVLAPSTPDLEGLLDKFRKVHYHTEDEVRFVVDGEGIFFITGQDGKTYEVLVQKGDLLIVAAGTWHWFDLTDQRRIKCVRIFQTTEGWQAIFKAQATVA
ncbi:MAG TPA: cupin domain-containing protein [Candidatus Xenobia bacterium]|jgi:1,2-dihydroxy-3-keto-5-methylthiopentene dioxygenase